MRNLAIALLLAITTATCIAQHQPSSNNAAETTKQKNQLAASEKVYKAAKATFQKTPNAKTKKAYVDATVAFGTKTMMSPVLGPKQKYGPALRLYREALKFDPKNAEALNNKKLIEDIYKQMGMPIPN